MSEVTISKSPHLIARSRLRFRAPIGVPNGARLMESGVPIYLAKLLLHRGVTLLPSQIGEGALGFALSGSKRRMDRVRLCPTTVLQTFRSHNHIAPRNRQRQGIFVDGFGA